MKKEKKQRLPDSQRQREDGTSKLDGDAGQPNLSPLQDETHEPADRTVPVFDFETLADGQRLVLIRLGGEVYTLRRTQGGKLLLNK